MVKNQLVIAAISSRIYVQAAVDAGYEVIALDAFADVDTQVLAIQSFQLPLKDDQFDSTALLALLQKLDLSQCLGFCYGGGFEAQPHLLAHIHHLIPIIGNSAITVKQSKSPNAFFSLCDHLKMNYPNTQFERPVNTINWLKKTVGGSGGTHIKPLIPLLLQIDLPTPSNHYYQKIQAGTPFSCLFLADGLHTQMIGFNEQWCAPTPLLPYRYAGAVSNATLDESVKIKIEDFIQNAVKELGLIGLNSCDFIVENDSVFMLEINPRLSATLDLYRAKKGYLFAAHVEACLGQLNFSPSVEKKSRAHHVVYTKSHAHVPADLDWPEWVSDVPQPYSTIPAGAPLCTVNADALTPNLAKKKVLQRVADL